VCEAQERISVGCGADQGGPPMTSHEEWYPNPDPKKRERQRQRVLTSQLLFVIAVLLGVLTPMLLKRLFL
jgi:hypothetical protein